MYNKNGKGKHMKCFYCDNEVRWNNDFDTEEIPEETYNASEYSIVSMYQCDKCDTWYEVFHTKKETNGD